MTGAVPRDEPTLHAVAQALRSGGSDDPRVDAYARQMATRQLRRRPWRLWIHALLVPGATAAAFLIPEHGAQRVVLTICWVLIAVLNGSTAWHLAGTRRRARQYLRKRPEA
jgi:hypothetical protein